MSAPPALSSESPISPAPIARAAAPAASAIGGPSGLSVAASAAIVLLAVTTAADAVPPVVLVADVLGLALPLAVGGLRIAHDPGDRFARLLVATGLLWSVATLSQSSQAVLFSVGSLGMWVLEIALVYLMLSYPDGRLATVGDRRLAVTAWLVLVLLYLPSALLAPFPEPRPLAPCGTNCPDNAFMLTSHAPAAFAGFAVPMREFVTAALFAAVAGVLIDRARASGPFMRKSLAPVAFAAVLHVGAIAVYFGARRGDPGGAMTEVVGSIYLFVLPVITLCFGWGLLRRRLFVADLLQRLAEELKPHVGPRELRSALATAMRDRDLQVLYRRDDEPDRWVDETGWPVEAPAESPGRAVTEVGAEAGPRAVIVHTSDLAGERDVLRAASSYALTALENERLVREVRSSLSDLSESRARVVAAADRERRRIERDLHDGAQQRLVALRVKLALAAERADDTAPDLADSIRRLGEDVDASIDELREFARGVYPAVLADRGLGDALRAAARRAPLATTVVASGIGRYPLEIEAALYFACVEALQNAAKHAHGATRVSVVASENGALKMTVSDDGSGFDPQGVVEGAGLRNLRDRMAAVGGTLTVESGLGRGSTVTATIPDAHRLRTRQPSYTSS